MPIINVNNWEEFEREIHKLSATPRLVFRGQNDSDWALDTTLERQGRKDMRFADCYKLIGDVQPQIEAFTATQWRIRPYPEILKCVEDYQRFYSMICGGLPENA